MCLNFADRATVQPARIERQSKRSAMVAWTGADFCGRVDPDSAEGRRSIVVKICCGLEYRRAARQVKRKSEILNCSREQPGINTSQLIYTLCRKMANSYINDQLFNAFLQVSSEQKQDLFTVSRVSFAVGVRIPASTEEVMNGVASMLAELEGEVDLHRLSEVSFQERESQLQCLNVSGLVRW